MRTGFQIRDYLRALFNFPSLQSDAQGKTCCYADRLVWCHCFALQTEKKKQKKKKSEDMAINLRKHFIGTAYIKSFDSFFVL